MVKRSQDYLRELQTPEQKKLKLATILMGINECLLAQFDIFESTTPYEKLIYTFVYKFI